MEIRLISKTQPVIGEVDSSNKLLSYIARVSNPQNQENWDTSDKLLKYLIENKHWSPFEMVDLTFEIVTTRDIARQLLRHRSFSFQEFSQRYSPVSVFDKREPRLQDPKNRQNSIDTDDKELIDWFNETQEYVTDFIFDKYKEAIHRGIAKEQARAFLPEGLTKSRLFMKGCLRSWIHYCQLRTANGTQKEHQEIAKEIWSVIIKEFPEIVEAVSKAAQGLLQNP